MTSVRARTTTELGGLIRERRRALKLDQRTLADNVGVSRQWIVDVEKGKPGIELGLVLRTLEALGLVADVIETPRAKPGKNAVDIDAIIERARGPR